MISIIYYFSLDEITDENVAAYIKEIRPAKDKSIIPPA